jgi:hypothetical protein
MVKSKTKRKIEDDKVSSNDKEKSKDKVQEEPQSDYESDQVKLYFVFSHVLLFTFEKFFSISHRRTS